MIEAWIESHLLDEVPQVVAVLDREYQIVKANKRLDPELNLPADGPERTA